MRNTRRASTAGTRQARCKARQARWLSIEPYSDRPARMKGLVSGPLLVPERIPRPTYALDVSGRPPPVSIFDTVLRGLSPWAHNALVSPPIASADDISGIRDACTLAAETLNMACELAVVPGTTTDDIDRAVHEV